MADTGMADTGKPDAATIGADGAPATTREFDVTIDSPTGPLRMHYRTHGDPAGIPVLLLHGGFGSSRWWLPLFAALPTEFYAIAPDLRGCGRSDKPANGYDVTTQALDLRAFVNALKLPHCALVAHAASGAIAIEFTLANPERVDALILIGTVPLEGAFTPLEGIHLLDQMRNDPALLREAIALLVPALVASGDPFLHLIVADAAQMAPAAFTEPVVALGQWNRIQEARALTLPTLLIWGDQDPIVDRDAMTRTLVTLPGATALEVLKDVGHAPMVDAPLALAERIVDFLTEDFGDYASIRDDAYDAGQKPQPDAPPRSGDDHG